MTGHRARVAKFVNSYPNIELSHEFEDTSDLRANEPITMRITLERDIEEEDAQDPADSVVDAPYYPGKKMVNWWLVVGDPATRALYGIKKVTVKKTLQTKLDITLPQGAHSLKLYLICDSYMGEWLHEHAQGGSQLIPLRPMQAPTKTLISSRSRSPRQRTVTMMMTATTRWTKTRWASRCRHLVSRGIQRRPALYIDILPCERFRSPLLIVTRARRRHQSLVVAHVPR